jgi:hypothetical protein
MKHFLACDLCKFTQAFKGESLQEAVNNAVSKGWKANKGYFFCKRCASGEVSHLSTCVKCGEKTGVSRVAGEAPVCKQCIFVYSMSANYMVLHR